MSPTSPASSITLVSPVSSSQAPVTNKINGDDEAYMRKMQNALSEMDKEHNFVIDGRFLDLGQVTCVWFQILAEIDPPLAVVQEVFLPTS